MKFDLVLKNPNLNDLNSKASTRRFFFKVSELTICLGQFLFHIKH